MISIHKAYEEIISHPISTGMEVVPLRESLGRILAEAILSDRPAPPFNRVSMDGVGIVGEEYLKGRREFPLSGLQAAGMPPLSLDHRDQALEVMTGAVLPDGVDTVVPYEQIKVADSLCKIEDGLSIAIRQNIHDLGRDHGEGTELLSPGERITEHHIAVAASVGKSDIAVRRSPSIAVISTGTELVEVDETPLAHQIRRSNSHGAEAALVRRGYGTVSSYHIPDDESVLEQKIEALLEEHEVLILSGGVSMGKLDFLPAVFDKIGVEKVFHKIAQKPGKPFWFGVRGNRRVYALPGNPVSMMVCLHRYIIPALDTFFSGASQPVYYPLGEDIKPKARLGLFVPVKLNYFPDKPPLLTKVSVEGSGDYASLAGSAGIAEIPPSDTPVPAGTFVRYFSWRF